MLKRYGDIFWIVSGTSIIIVILFILIAWFRKIWIKYIPALGDSTDDDILDNNVEPQPVIFKILYNFSYTIMNNIIPRTVIYLIIVLLLIIVSLINLVFI